ncbi:MAG: F0F1 ATP synthase subunit delta [Rectinemataceae bacterium]
MGDNRRAWAKGLHAACGSLGASLPGAEAVLGERIVLADTLVALGQVLEGEGPLKAILEDPALSKKRRIDLLTSVLPRSASPGLRKIFGNFSEMAIKGGKIDMIPHLAQAFRDLVDADERVVRLEVEAVNLPTPGRVRELADAWGSCLAGFRVETTVIINPTLIGGYRLRSGSVRFDHSIAGRVERLRRHLSRPLDAGRGKG